MTSSLTFANNVLHYTFDTVSGGESLVHFNGVNGSSTFTDSTGKHTWVRGAGAAVIDTSQSKFGGASVKFGSFDQIVGDGTINWGTNDFTVDFWIYLNGTVGQANIFEMISNATGVIYTLGDGLHPLAFYNSGDMIYGTTPVSFNAWHHVALTRQGANHYLFLDGHLEGNWSSPGLNWGTSPAQYPVIGQGGGYSPSGWIDELRILIGNAAWTSSFTPPTAPYSSIGTTVTDSSVSNDTGTIHGSDIVVPGQIGNALSFNGNDYITLASVSQFAITQTGPFSTSFWVKTTQTSGIIFALRGSNAGGQLGVMLMSVGYASGVADGMPAFITQGDNGSGWGTYGGVVSTVAVNDGNWHHIAVTRDATQLCSMYIDGGLNTTAYDGLSGAGITPIVANSLIGVDTANLNYSGYVGLLDDFQIYNRALTATEVSSIRQAGVSGAITGTANFAGNGILTARGSQIVRNAFTLGALAPSGSLTAQLTLHAVPHSYALAAGFSGGGGFAPPSLNQVGIPLSRQLAATFNGSGGWLPTWYLAYLKKIHYPAQLALTANFAGAGGFLINAPDPIYNIYMTTDRVNPGIYPTAGSEVLYRQASGLERATADVDAGRLIATYAELVRDQWDPWAISYRNLGYLAWAQGVNLWEDDWAEPQRRQWVANQWTFKYYRGSDLGMKMAVEAVGAKLKNIVRPPALFMPGAPVGDALAALLFLVPNARYSEGIGDVGTKQWYMDLTWLDSRRQPTWTQIVNADRQLYVQRFPQLRLYPFAPRPQLPWLNYLGGKSYDGQGNPIPVKNGFYFGPYRPFYPTNFNAGGKYLRKCTLYEPRTGVETQLTVRTIVAVPTPGQKVITFDEIQMPRNPGNLFFPGEGNKQYLFPRGVSLAVNRRHAVVLGRLPNENGYLIRIPRDGTLSITQFQAIFSTIVPSLQPINVSPEMVSVVHPMRSSELYGGQLLRKKYQPKSNAWQFLYERWYLFDPTRQPDQRWARVFMGRARFGITKYTAKVKIDAPWHWPRHYARAGGFMGPGHFFAPRNTKRIDQVRRAVTAAMALRDTVLIDTKVKRMTQLRDITLLDGTFSFGAYITDSW